MRGGRRADARATRATGIVGVGLDAVDVARFRRIIERRPSFVPRVFAPSELADLSRRADKVPGLAARFAAKEATMKALGVGLGTVGLSEIAVARAESGAPSVVLSGRAAARAVALGVTSVHVSLTHTATLAGAIVVAG